MNKNKRKTRILFVLITLGVGGSEKAVYDITQSIDKDRYEVFLAAFEGGELKEKFERHCKCVVILKKSKGLDIMAMVNLAKLIKKYKIDIVNAHHFMPCFYSFLGTCILNSKRLIYTEHSCPEVEGFVKDKYSKILFKIMLFRLEAVIGVSREIQQTFKRHYPKHANKIYIVYNGVDTEKFKSIEKRNDIRAKYGLESHHMVIGTVANFRKVKNHVCLIRSVARLKNIYPNLKLIFVGKGKKDDLDNSEKQIKDEIDRFELQERIIFLGYQENIPDILNAFDLFCLPSISEGFPVSILEAMSAGIPIVGSKVRGISEIIIEGFNGSLFQSNDDEGLAKILSELIENEELRKKYIANGCNFVRENFALKNWIDKYINVLL